MFFFISILLKAISITCPSYSCPPAGFTFKDSSTCMQERNTSIYLQSCPSGTVCNSETSVCGPPESSYELGYAGDRCTSNSKCSSFSCVSGTCEGKNLNSSCSDHEDCNPGLRCSQSGICINLIQIGQSGCTDDYECANNAGCNVTGSTGTCIEYFSQPIEAFVNDCNNGVSKLCKTAECIKLPKFSLLGKCKIATQSLNSIPNNCSSNIDCKGTDGVDFFTGFCSCGFNANRNAYCSPFPGDMPGLAYYSVWKNALGASVGICNTLRRFSESCLELIGFKERVLEVTWGYVYYSQIQNNDACVKNVLTEDYYGSDDSGLLLFVGSLVFLV